jgi:hypothetical protein
LFLQKVVYVTKRGLNMKDKFLSGIGI